MRNFRELVLKRPGNKKMKSLLHSRTIVCLMSVLALVWTVSAHAAPLRTLPGVTSLTVEEVIDLAIDGDPPVIIDSRIPADYERGHLQGAVNIVDTEMTAEILAQAAARDQDVLFYCNGADCVRSRNACIKAVEWGWTSVFWFPGGIAEWNENELPLEK